MESKPYFFSLKALIRDKQGRCLLLQRSATSKHNAGKWDLPGGKVDEGEDAGKALLREILEETGLRVTLERVAGTAESDLPDRKVAYLIFEAKAEHQIIQRSSEHDGDEWFAPGQLDLQDICPQFRTFLRHYLGEAEPAAKDQPESPCEFIKHQVEEFKLHIGDYKVFAQVLEEVLMQAIREMGILAIVQARPKDLISFFNKCCKKQEDMDLKKIAHRRPFAHSFTDLCGARVIVEFRDQAEQVCTFIRSHFEIDERNSVNPKTALRSDEFAYRSDHLIVSLKPGEFTEVWDRILTDQSDEKARKHLEAVRQRLIERRETPERQHGADLPPGPKYKAEIQVKTLLEHAWSNINHDRIYKGAIAPPAELKREMNRVSALLEEADEVFARVVRDIDTYGSHTRQFLTEKERNKELCRLDYAMQQAPDRVELAIRHAQLAAENKQWSLVIATLAPHFAKWQASDHGSRFARSYGEFNQDDDLVKKKRAEIEMNHLREPRTASLLMEFGWAKWNLPARTATEKHEAREHLLQAALLDNCNAEAHIRSGKTFAHDTLSQLSHYEAAFKIAPGDPGILHEVLYTKLRHGRPLAELPQMRSSLLAAIQLCRRRADVGLCLPDAFFQVGFFQMLLEQGQEHGHKPGPSIDTVWSDSTMMQSLVSSLIAYAKAADLTTKGSDLTLQLDRQRTLRADLAVAYPGSDWVERLLLVESSAKLWVEARQEIKAIEKERDDAAKRNKPLSDESVKQRVHQIEENARTKAIACFDSEPSLKRPHFESPIVIFVGGCSEAAMSVVTRFRTHIENALEGFKGTVIGGGTDAGISGIVGRAHTQPGAVRKLAYIKTGVRGSNRHKLLEDPLGVEGYVMVPLMGDGFTPMEILQMWTDILAAGINPADVIVLGVNGGLFSGFELRLALSLGALVGVIRESGGASRVILDDPDWKQHNRLLDIPDDVQTVKALVVSNRTKTGFDSNERDQIAEKFHEERAEDRRRKNTKPADREWRELGPFFLRDVRERIAYWDVLLEANGMRLCKLDQAPTGKVEVKEFTEPERELMAEMEHARWIVNRLSGGQRHGAEKKDEETHPSIVPWRQLPKDEQEKDRDYVAQMLRANEFGYGVFRIGPARPANMVEQPSPQP